MEAMTRMDPRINQEIVTIGIATMTARGKAAGLSVRGGGTMSSIMFAVSSFSNAVLSLSAEGTGVRALWVVALAFVALAAIDRMKPATRRRPVPVRVDHKVTPLYREPDRQHRMKAAAGLSGVAVVTGAVVACVLGFLLAIALDVVGGLLRS